MKEIFKGNKNRLRSIIHICARPAHNCYICYNMCEILAKLTKEVGVVFPIG